MSDQRDERSSAIECAQHGSSRGAFVCEHVAQGCGLGFHFFPDPGNPRPDAWCSACETIRQKYNGWDEESQKLIKIVLLCGECYDQARQFNDLAQAAHCEN